MDISSFVAIIHVHAFIYYIIVRKRLEASCRGKEQRASGENQCWQTALPIEELVYVTSASSCARYMIFLRNEMDGAYTRIYRYLYWYFQRLLQIFQWNRVLTHSRLAITHAGDYRCWGKTLPEQRSRDNGVDLRRMSFWSLLNKRYVTTTWFDLNVGNSKKRIMPGDASKTYCLS